MPRVVGNTEPEVQERSPPDKQVRHKWLSEGGMEALSSFDPEMYLHKNAEEKIRNHAISMGDEVMGLLLGGVYQHRGEPYVIIRDVATTDLDATRVSVRFSREGYERLFDSLESSWFDYVIVGWYHSHPGHTCFLSEVDVATQAAMFDQDHHCALVIDPVNQEIDAFHLRDGVVMRRPFVVYWETFEDPYRGVTVRHRRLSSDPDGVTL